MGKEVIEIDFKGGGVPAEGYGGGWKEIGGGSGGSLAKTRARIRREVAAESRQDAQAERARLKEMAATERAERKSQREDAQEEKRADRNVAKFQAGVARQVKDDARAKEKAERAETKEQKSAYHEAVRKNQAAATATAAAWRTGGEAGRHVAQIGGALGVPGAEMLGTLASGASAGPAGLAAAAGVVLAEAIGGAIRSVYTTTENLAATAAKYNGPVAVAAAQANIAQITGDIGRSNVLSQELAGFTTQQSRLSQIGQDLLVELLKPIIPLLVRFLELSANTLENIMPKILTFIDGLVDGVNIIQDNLEKVINSLPGIHVALGRIAKNTDRDKFGDGSAFIQDLMTMQAPAMPRPKADEAIRDVGQRLGIPAFNGF